MNFDKCIRIDRQDGRQSDCTLQYAHKAIDKAYSPSQPAKDALHNGQVVSTMFADYQIVRVS